MTKIVVLDGNALFKDDLTLNGLKALGEVSYFERTAKEKTVEKIGNAEIVVTNKVFIDKEVIDACPNMRYIAITATGYNVVDLNYARQKGIKVSNVPAYSTDSVVQHTFALLLELCAASGKHSDSVKDGAWNNCADFCYTLTPISELSGKVFGIIGYGNIGKAVARVATAFNMKILIHNRTPFEGSVTADEVFKNADVVSLHCPLNEDNREIVNKRTLSIMKPTAFVINTARGGLIAEQDLADALNEGKIAGAGLDVLSAEPPKMNNPLLRAKNCIITPHVAWASLEARTRLLQITEENIAAYINGCPQNVLNP